MATKSSKINCVDLRNVEIGTPDEAKLKGYSLDRLKRASAYYNSGRIYILPKQIALPGKHFKKDGTFEWDPYFCALEYDGDQFVRIRAITHESLSETFVFGMDGDTLNLVVKKNELGQIRCASSMYVPHNINLVAGEQDTLPEWVTLFEPIAMVPELKRVIVPKYIPSASGTGLDMANDGEHIIPITTSTIIWNEVVLDSEMLKEAQAHMANDPTFGKLVME